LEELLLVFFYKGFLPCKHTDNNLWYQVNRFSSCCNRIWSLGEGRSHFFWMIQNHYWITEQNLWTCHQGKYMPVTFPCTWISFRNWKQKILNP